MNRLFITHLFVVLCLCINPSYLLINHTSYLFYSSDDKKQENHSVLVTEDAIIANVSYENSTALSFVDGDCPATDFSIINVPDNLLITDINIGFNATILYRHHVTATLVSPSGTSVILTTNGAYSGASPSISNWDVLFDEASSNPLNDGDSDDTSSPYYENERTANPSGNLDDFNGENAMGEWRLYVCDYRTDVDNGGTLNRWKIDIVGNAPCPANGDTPVTSAGTCNGNSANNDATVSISNIVSSDRADISTAGAATYDGNNYANATSVSGSNISFTGLEHSKSYIIRIYETGGGCFTDVSFLSATAPAQCPSIPADLPWSGSTCDGYNIMLQNGIGALTCGVTTATSAADRWAFGLVNFDDVIPASGRSEETSAAEMYHHPSWHVDSIGNVFGIAINSRTGDIFIAASSNYGAGFLGNNAVIRYGAIAGGTTSGSNDSAAGGAIYKIEKSTGQATVFAMLPQQSSAFDNEDCESSDILSRTNSSPGLGNIVYDEAHDQYFVTNIEDGRIYRLNNAGTILDSYDPFSNDNGAAGISNIEEIVYGLAIERSSNRLFFGGTDLSLGSDAEPGSPGIYSISLTATGGFPGTINNTNMPSGVSYNNYEQNTETAHATIPIDGGVLPGSASGDLVYLISDLDFNTNGDLVVGVRVSCNSSFFSSYNHYSEVNIVTKNTGTGIFNNSVTELDVSATGSYADEDTYGGVATYVDNNGNDIIAVSSADILNESGPHGVAVFNDPPNSGSINPLAAISYGVAGNDPKGVGGDVNLWTSCTCIITADITEQCHNNDTRNVSTDDYSIFTISATSSNPGANNQYEVVYNGVILATQTYGTDSVMEYTDLANTQRFAADGTSTYSLIIRDANDNTCAETIVTNIVNSCSSCPPTICLPVQTQINKTITE